MCTLGLVKSFITHYEEQKQKDANTEDRTCNPQVKHQCSASPYLHPILDLTKCLQNIHVPPRTPVKIYLSLLKTQVCICAFIFLFLASAMGINFKGVIHCSSSNFSGAADLCLSKNNKNIP